MKTIIKLLGWFKSIEGVDLLKNGAEMWLFYKIIRFLETYALFLQARSVKRVKYTITHVRNDIPIIYNNVRVHTIIN